MKLHTELKQVQKSSLLYAVAIGAIFTFNQTANATQQDFTLQGMPPEIKEKIIGMTGNDDMQEMKKWGEVSKDFNEAYKRALAGHAITVKGSQLNDNTVESLKHVGNLHLRLTSDTTDETMKLVGKLTNLTNLYLIQTGITNAGLAHLAGLKNLQKLSLAYTKVTAAGLLRLRSLTNLQYLSLEGSGVLGGLEYLKDLKNLQELNLMNTKIDDTDLADLKLLKNLQKLALSWTTVSDKGLTYLQGLKNLKLLNVVNTKVTDAGVEELKKSIPGLEVHAKL